MTKVLAGTNLLLTCTNTAPWAACGDDVFECSNCGWDYLCCDIRDDELNYCPNCGAKIIKGDANELEEIPREQRHCES